MQSMETETTHSPFSPREIIESLAQHLQEKYIFPDVAHEITTVLHQHLANGAYDEIRDGKLLEQALNTHLLEVSHDCQGRCNDGSS